MKDNNRLMSPHNNWQLTKKIIRVSGDEKFYTFYP